ncbi:MAG: hypothetical protein J6U50_04445, partial [Lachnospiraceae bacterium]|nr:hypothetical protein [Lachnospiraceae bacterium]
MAYADESGNREFAVNRHGEIEWDVKKTGEYFKECQRTYDAFLKISDEFLRAFAAFENDEAHTGPEADSAKAFVRECQIPLIEGIVDNVQQLETLQAGLMEAFSSEVDASELAIVKTAHLKKIIADYMKYEASLKDTGEKIKELAKNLNAECSEVGKFTKPEYKGALKAMEEMVSEDGINGHVPKLKDDLLTFDRDHSNDIKGSDFQKLHDILSDNVKKFTEGIGDGIFGDIVTFDELRKKLEWTDPADKLTGEALEEYKQFIKDMEDYLRGEKLRCEVYKYDPVNMCNGNYINKHTDMDLWGRYPIEFERFYNAVSDTAGALGKGWSHSFEINIYEEDGKYRINYADGSKGSFVRVGDVYLEEHGEPGTLEKTADGYVIRQDEGTYQKFDGAGYLTVLGDMDGDNTFLTYDQSRDGELRLTGVRTSCGNELSFSYDDNGENKGLIRKITDQSGRSVSYAYEEDRLVSVTDTDGGVRGFTYSEDGRIKDVINPKGITAITNEYDVKGRTIKQSFPDGSSMTYSYDDDRRTTTATEQNGNRVVYTHDELGRHTRTAYYDGEERFTYNDKNLKTSATDKKGNTTRFAYDNKGHLTKITDALGNKTHVTYRADGKPLAVKGAKGEEYKYSYDTEGKLFELRNPLDEKERFYYRDGNLCKNKNAEGGATLYDHDERGNIKRITDPDGVAVIYEYDDLNRIVSSTTADGAKTAYEYDDANRLIKTTDALGNTREYTYDRMGKVTSVKEPDGTVRSYEMDVMERVSKVTDQLGNVTQISYNVMGKQEQILLPNGGAIRYEYDPLMRVTKVTDPEGRTTGYDYDKNGNVTAEYTGDIRERTYVYDALNRVTKVRDALGHERTFEYDEGNQVIAVSDASGNRFTRDYDVLGRVIAETDPLGNRTEYTYTKLGGIETITDPAGRVRRFEYTKGGKLRAEYFCEKPVQKASFDSAGRIEKRIFSDGYEISYSYDPLSRVSLVEGSDGRRVSYEYDAMGRATKVCDGSSTTLYTYTATGRLKSVVDPLGNETAYTYDALDNLKSVHRAEGLIGDGKDQADEFPTVGMDGHVTLYSYDLSGQLSSITDALGQKEIYEYDQYGRLKSRKDRDDFVTSYDYNELGAVTKVGYGDGRSVEFAYNELGQLREINDWLGKTTIENDVLGRLTKVTDYQNRTVGYEYNAVGERIKLTYPDGRAAVYTYDEEGRLSGITGNGEDTRYSYDAIGRLTEKLLPNGVRQAYSYLPGGNLESMTSTDKEGELDKYFYTYNSSGLISGINRKRRGLDAVSGQYDYRYDAIGRLTQTSHDGQIPSAYEYEAFGNRTALTENGTKTTYSYDVLDRLMEARELNNSQAVVKTYDYDKRGNQTKEFIDGLLQKTFTFDATNMLSKVVDKDKGELENFYNGLGFRVASIRSEEKIEYLCDLSKDYYNLLERTVNGETESFVYDNNVIS